MEGEKADRVFLLRDIDIRKPHAGHLRILNDMRIERRGRKAVTSFDALWKQWQQVFSTDVLTERFYSELSDWFFWACRNVTFPSEPKREGFVDADNHGNAVQTHNSTSVIRLITRLLFTWFLKEKGLIAWHLFDQTELKLLLKGSADPSQYYKAILQNLFFATLNQEMGLRQFRVNSGSDYGVQTRYRYRDFFAAPERFLELQRCTPFLNCGLFECQDKPHPTQKNERGNALMVRLDGFSDHPDNPLSVPDNLFWGAEIEVDLRVEYGQDKAVLRKVRGLIHILDSYKFTITENTPLEQDIALDPELLGRVFENLLAAYNPETSTTARKASGSFYTRRPIVDYMVTESLVAYLAGRLGGDAAESADDANPQREDKLRALLSDSDDQPFNVETEVVALVGAFAEVKILDPACGSGAFPMGALHRMVQALRKLDPDNRHWRAVQERIAAAEAEGAIKIGDEQARDQALLDISDSFKRDSVDFDYARKLYLIERCIYGVDIQSIATQISRLRFFISLMVDQQIAPDADNLGVKPLPNLDTKFVTANTLLALDHEFLKGDKVIALERKLADIRHRHFQAKSWDTKKKYRQEDRNTRAALATALRDCGMPADGAEKMAAWDPYDQNASAPFFDPAWMFSVSRGFDVVIGNPPYLESRHPAFGDAMKDELQGTLRLHWGRADAELITRGADLLVYFFPAATRLLAPYGLMTFITQNSWLNTEYGQGVQSFLMKHCYVRLVVDSAARFFGRGTGPEINTVISIFGHIETAPAAPDRSLTLICQSGSGVGDEVVRYAHSNPMLATKWGALFRMASTSRKAIDGLLRCALTVDHAVGQGVNLRGPCFIPRDVVERLSLGDLAVPVLTKSDGAPFRLSTTEMFLIPERDLDVSARAKLTAGGFQAADLSESRLRSRPTFILPRGVGNRHFGCENAHGALSASYVEISLSRCDKRVHLWSWALVNSTVFWILREIYGRTNLGGGLLKAEACDIRDMPVVVRLSHEDRVERALSTLAQRQAASAAEELASPEHVIIDEAVGEAIGLSHIEAAQLREQLRQMIAFREARATT